MNRRNFLQLTGAAALPWLFSGCASAGEELLGTVQKPRSFWKPLLPDAAYRVLFEEDTEPSHTSPLVNEHRAGTFICAACYLPLFDASKKYESGTGWPSFWQPLPDVLVTKTDHKLFFERTAYQCARCGGHHGHRFDDGPAPTGLRYCNNGVSLNFVPKGDALPQLRG